MSLYQDGQKIVLVQKGLLGHSRGFDMMGSQVLFWENSALLNIKFLGSSRLLEDARVTDF